MKKALKCLILICSLMLIIDIIQLVIAYRERQEQFREKAIERLKRMRDRIKG